MTRLFRFRTFRVRRRQHHSLGSTQDIRLHHDRTHRHSPSRHQRRRQFLPAGRGCACAEIRRTAVGSRRARQPGQITKCRNRNGHALAIAQPTSNGAQTGPACTQQAGLFVFTSRGARGGLAHLASRGAGRIRWMNNGAYGLCRAPPGFVAQRHCCRSTNPNESSSSISTVLQSASPPHDPSWPSERDLEKAGRCGDTVTRCGDVMAKRDFRVHDLRRPGYPVQEVR
jgi:hypothetical protein